MTPAEAAATRWQGRIVRVLRNRENHVYEMITPAGRAALRLHRAGYQSAGAIRSELWWCGELSRAGLPVPAPLPALDGDMLVALPDGRHASAVAWLDGEALGEADRPFPRPVSEARVLYETLGALLRQMHRATDALVLPPGFVRPRWDRDGLVGETPFWGRFWEHPAASADERRALVRARDALRERLDGPVGLIHADVLRENVLVNDRSVSLIDFDDSGFGYRLHDLGTALVQTVLRPEHETLRDALMDGYGTTDREGVEGFILARALASVGWTMPRLSPDDPVHKSHLARAMHCVERVLGRL